jgi:hypothetical protein
VLIVQGDGLNFSRIATVVCGPGRSRVLLEEVLAGVDVVLGR